MAHYHKVNNNVTALHWIPQSVIQFYHHFHSNANTLYNVCILPYYQKILNASLESADCLGALITNVQCVMAELAVHWDGFIEAHVG